MATKQASPSDQLPPDEWQRQRALQVTGKGAAGGPELPKDRANGGGIPQSSWGGSPASRESVDAMRSTPMNPKAARYFPVIGPAIEAVEDFRAGKPFAAVGDVGFAVGDGFLIYTGAGIAAAFRRGTALNTGKMTANAIQSQLHRRGVAGAGQEVHHTFDLAGIPRNVENWRNHPAFIRVLPKADHRRIHGRWGDLPKFTPLEATLVGIPTWMKTLPAGLAPRTVDGIVGLLHPDEAAVAPRLPPPAPYGERPLR